MATRSMRALQPGGGIDESWSTRAGYARDLRLEESAKWELD
jgi:hypothetical protein